MKKLTLKDLITINKEICNKTNEPFGILNKDNILSSLSIQYNNYYNSENLMLCSLLKSLVLSHGFQQGNKRTAFIAIIILKTPKCEPELLSEVILNIANGSLRDIEIICGYLYN